MADGADHLLLDTVRRRLRQPDGWVAVVLHLSRLAPPAPRPHHRRIARVLMEDVARRHDGLVFAVANGDLLLLCRMGDERRAAPTLRVASPQALPDVLARLLRADAPQPDQLTSFWPLESAGPTLLSYALARVATASIAPIFTAELLSQPAAIDAMIAAMNGPEVADLLHRQIGVVVAEDGMRPLFREIRFSMAALEARITQVGRIEPDPFLSRHLAERLDQRLLGLVMLALGGGSGLDPEIGASPRLHLNLTLASLRSEAFARLAKALLGRGLSLGVEISVLEACADPDRFEQARSALRRLDMSLILDGVSRQTLRLARVTALQPDLVKLAWSPRMAGPEQGQHDAEQRLIGELGPARVVLHHADDEAALHWGLKLGIRRFQGRHVDVMLGALRQSACPLAARCSLPQCVERAAATDAQGRRHAEGRRDCGNIRLLDAGGPGQMSPLAAAGAPAPARISPAWAQS